ncbi:MAG: hypothetical protein AAB330_04135 [Bacteroidota bacterium]
MLRAILFVLAACIYLACMDDPNPVGGSLLPPSDLPIIKIDTMYPSSHSTSATRYLTISATRLMLGKFQNYESWALIGFTLPESLRVAVIKINDAKIQLRANYHFGDSLSPLSFIAHRALKSLSGDSLTLDSLNAGGYYDPNPVSSPFNSIIGDTDKIQFSIDTAMVRSWFVNFPDTVSANLGVVFRPTNTNVIKGFMSFSESNPTALRPQLIIQYTKGSDTGSVAISAGGARFIADISYQNLVQNLDLVYVQSGVSYLGFLNFLNTNPIPAKASIHRAQLELTLNPGASRFNSYTVDSLVVFFVDAFGINPLAPTDISESKVVAGQKVYAFDIQQYIQGWVRGSPDRSVAIQAYSFRETLDLFVFYGENSGAALKPRVVVTYSPTQ